MKYLYFSILILLLPITAHADVYKRTDEEGRVHYSDIPPTETVGHNKTAGKKDLLKDPATDPAAIKREAVSTTVPPSTRGKKRQRTVITISTLPLPRMCPYPDCALGEEILRIPLNMQLSVFGIRSVSFPRWNVLWYRVKYRGRTGWISEFSTTRARR